MRPTQLDQPVALGPKSGPRGCPGPPKGLFWAKMGPFRGPRSAVEVSQGARAHDMNAAHPVGPTSGTRAKIRPPGAAQGPVGPPKWSFWAKTGPFGGPGSAVEVYYRARAHDMNAAHPVGPTSGTWAQIRPPGAAQGPPGPPKGPIWAITGPFGGPRSAVVVS